MGRYKELFTRQELKGKLGYRLTDHELTSLQYGSMNNKKYYYSPVIKEGVDWYESKLNNVFYYKSALRKLEKYLKDKDKKKLTNNFK